MTDEEMLDLVRQRAAELGHVPSKSEMKGVARLKARFGPWNRMLEAAGLKEISKRTQEKLVRKQEKLERKQEKHADVSDKNRVMEVKK